MRKYILALVLVSFLITTSSSAATNVSLLNNDSEVKFLKVGSSGPAVSSLQAYLANQGLYTKKVDGKFGPGTKAALVAYQKLAGLVPDGSAGPHTFKFMNIYPGIKLSTANNKTLAYLRSLYQTQNKNVAKTSLNLTAGQALSKVLTVPSKPLVLALSNTNTGQGSNTNIIGINNSTNTTNSSNNQTANTQQNTSSSSVTNNQSQGLSLNLGQNTSQSGQSITQNLVQNSTNTNSGTSAPVYYLNNNNTLTTTTTPWWQANTITTNYNDPNASIPLSGYPFEFKISADAVFTLYAYKIGTNGKVSDLQPVCKNMNATVYGVPTWKNYKKCTKFTLPQDYNLALAVADNGVTAGAWIGSIEIVGNKYYSQDYAWRYAISQSTVAPNIKDFVTTQISNEINTAIFGPTEVIGYYGTDPWGVFIDDENDHSFDEAAWIKAVDPGLKKFAIYTLKNGGTAVPVSNIDLMADSEINEYGDSVTLTWSTQNVSSCNATSTPNNVAWTGAKSKDGGEITINNLTQSTTFNITCVGLGGQISDSVLVKVKPTVEIKANNQNSLSVIHDSVVSITWTSVNATSCSASGGSGNWEDSNNSNGQINTTGTFTSEPLPADEIYVFTVTCSNANGSATDSVSVEVGPTTQVSLSANPTTLSSPGNVVLSWTPKFVNSCTASSTPANNQWTGSKTTNNGTATITGLSVTTEFKITCIGFLNEQVMSMQTVTVNNPNPPTVDISANPLFVSSGGNTVINWNPQNATSCTALSTPTNNQWTGSKSISGGSITITNLTVNTEFKITCSNTSGQQVNDTVLVSIASAQATVELSATRSVIPAGGTVELNWTTNNTTGMCTASNNKNNFAWVGPRPNSYPVPFTFVSNLTTIYTLTCNAVGGGTVQDSVTVTADTTPINGTPYIVSNSMIQTGDRQASYFIHWSEPVFASNYSTLRIKSADDSGDGDLDASEVTVGDIYVYIADYSDNNNYNNDDLVGTGTLLNATFNAADNNEPVTNLTIPNPFNL